MDREKTQRGGVIRALAPLAPEAWINFFSLGVLRATDALAWLFLTPLLVRRLGIDTFGMIAVVQVILNYGKTIIDFGFHITGVRSVALSVEEPHTLQRVLSEAIVVRMLLGGCFVAGMAVLIAFVGFFHPFAAYFYWAWPFLLTHVLFTDWFFIGLQRVPYVAAVLLLARIGFVVLTVLLVHSPADGARLFFLHGITALPGAIALLLVLRFRWKLRPLLPARAAIVGLLRTDFRLLFSNLAIEMNHSFPLLALNLLTTNAITGYFSVIQKLTQPVRFLLVIFSQTIFPIACRHLRQGSQAVWTFLVRVTRTFSLAPITVCLGLAIFSRPILTCFAGPAPDDALWNFRFFLLVPLIVLLNIPAYQYLLAYEKKRGYSRVYLGSLLLTIVLSLLLVKARGLSGGVLTVLLVESGISLSLHGLADRVRRKSPGA